MATREVIAKLYVATFNRAADADGLKYWINDGTSSTTGLTNLEDIAAAMLESSEASILYEGLSREDTVIRMYDNLFNRDVDSDDLGVQYWANGGGSSIPLNLMIKALIDGADVNDSAILDAKAEVGMYYADMDLNNISYAKSVMYNITSSKGSINNAKSLIDTISNTTLVDDGYSSKLEIKLANGDSIDTKPFDDIYLDNISFLVDGVQIQLDIDYNSLQQSTDYTNLLNQIDQQLDQVLPSADAILGDYFTYYDPSTGENMGKGKTIEIYTKQSNIESASLNYIDAVESSLQISLANTNNIATNENPIENFSSIVFNIDGITLGTDISETTSYEEVVNEINDNLDEVGFYDIDVRLLDQEAIYFSTDTIVDGTSYVAGTFAGYYNPIEIFANDGTTFESGYVNFDINNEDIDLTYTMTESTVQVSGIPNNMLSMMSIEDILI